jgi:hypothetical protein
MNQRIIYTNENGGVCVVVPAPDSGLTIEEIAAKDVPKGVPFEIVDVETISSDRTFRNAWERNGKAVNVNIPKAREIAHEKRRAARAAKFAPLDIEATIPAKAAEAEAKREAIRQKYAVMQTAIDSAQTVEALKTALGLQ